MGHLAEAVPDGNAGQVGLIEVLGQHDKNLVEKGLI